MKKKLYSTFNHWFYADGQKEPGEIYFYSDPHFSDEEMKYLRKNYIGDEEQVKKINSKIGKNDTIVFLGDIGNTDFIKKIRGYKVLIMGNHDKGPSNYRRVEKFISKDEYNSMSEEEKKEFSRVREVSNLPNCDFTERLYYLDNCLFDEVYDGPLFISNKILLTHAPIKYDNGLNIHGHDHSNRDFVDDLHLNVCAENINYTPISLSSIIKSGRLAHILDLNAATVERAKDGCNK